MSAYIYAACIDWHLYWCGSVALILIFSSQLRENIAPPPPPPPNPFTKKINVGFPPTPFY